MPVKLSKYLVEAGENIKLEEKFAKEGLGENDIVGRIKLLAKLTYPNSEDTLCEVTNIKLTNGWNIPISEVGKYPEKIINEVYRKLYKTYVYDLKDRYEIGLMFSMNSYQGNRQAS